MSQEFALSERQAYRYLEEAAHLELPVEVARLRYRLRSRSRRQQPAFCGLCEKQWPDHRSDRYTRIGRVSRYSEKAWLSRAHPTARFKFTLNMYLIACTNQNSSRPTVFWCPIGSVPLAGV